MFVKVINHFNFKSITQKFLEPGNTFMAADSVHAAIEKKMKKVQQINNYSDFIAVVEKSDQVGIKIILLSFGDFLGLTDETSLEVIWKTQTGRYVCCPVSNNFKKSPLWI